MGLHEQFDDDERAAGDLAKRYAAMCIDEWTKKGMPRGLLAPALLAASINLMLEADDADEVAHVLAGLASEISTPTVGSA